MLKKLLITCAVAGVSSGLAMADPVPYVGASIGVVTNTTSGAADTNQPGNFRGVPFNLYAGYGGVMDQNFYFAAEIFGTVGTIELSNHNGLKTSYGIGASVIPGVVLTDYTMAYVRGGFVRTQFSNVSNMGTGAQVGVGIQTSVTQNIDLRGEYDYTAYRSVSGISSPNQDAFNLGLVYKFE